MSDTSCFNRNDKSENTTPISNITNRITHDKFLFFSTYLLYYQSSMLDCQRSNSGQYKIKPEQVGS